MPRIERFFANQKVNDWTSGALGGGAGGVTTWGSGGEVGIYTDPAGQMWFSHYITGTGNFTVEDGAFDIDVLLVAGGGTGGGPAPSPWGFNASAGGGAGGARVLPAVPVGPTGGPAGNGVYPLVIGAGAAPPAVGSGTDSSAFGYTAAGGGTGAPWPTYPGSYPYWTTAQPGGSGGGITHNSWGYAAPNFIVGAGNDPPVSPPQGNPGGTGAYNYGGWGQAMGAGGGGGAGGTGGTATSGSGGSWSPNAELGNAKGGTGGAGIANDYRTGSTQYYAGGGGGAGGNNWGAPSSPNWGGGSPGPGGGGSGGASPSGSVLPGLPNSQEGTDGTANTGGGGGGGMPASFGSGGSGVVIIRYKV